MKRLMVVAGVTLLLLFLLALATAPPVPVAADPGILDLKVTVGDNGAPIMAGSVETITTQLGHDGGTSPVNVRILDDLPGGLRLASPIQVQANQALPQRVIVRQGDIGWQGVITPGGGIRWRAQTQVGYCPTDDPCRITRTVTVSDGTSLITEALVLDVVPSDMLPSKVSVQTAFEATSFEATSLEATSLEATSLEDEATFILTASNANTVPVRLRLRLSSPAGTGFLLGVFETSITRAGADLGDGGGVAPQAVASSFKRQAEISVRLAAGETKALRGTFRLLDGFDDGTALPLRAQFCILDPGAQRCTPDSPAHIREALPLTYTVRSRDLGDAPDSTNSAAAAMTAYPTVPADFPTVFDPATGLPQGPAHTAIRPFHLGRRVSPEREADIGPDADGVNNLRPAANIADLDRADDGLAVHTLAFQNCQPVTLPVRVFIHPQAVTYFQNVDDDKLAYLNVWIDSNRDGSWDDVSTCGTASAAEHILVDAPVDVTALGAGIHNLPFATAPVPWPQAQAQRPAWIRVTLSERPANKTLSGGAYGDGRGYATPFATGETEDYLYTPPGADGFGPDMEITGGWLPTGDERLLDDATRLLVDAGQRPDFTTLIRLRNRGTETANNVALNLRGYLTATVLGGTFYRREFGAASGDSDICGVGATELGVGTTSVDLGNFAPGCGGTVVLGWTGCLTCPLAAQRAGVESSVAGIDFEVTSDKDILPTNNALTAQIDGVVRAPQIAVARASDVARQGVTGAAALGQVNLRIAMPAGSEGVLLGSDGTTLGIVWCLTCTEPRPTVVPVTAIPIQYRAAITEDGELGPLSRPIEIACTDGIVDGSLHFTDAAGRTYFPESERFMRRLGGTIPGVWREPLTATVQTCADAPVLGVTFSTKKGGFTLTDQGGGVFSGLVDFTAAQSRLAVDAGASLAVTTADTTYETDFEVAAEQIGRVTDATTGVPIAGAEIAVLVEEGLQAGTETTTRFVVWDAALFGQSNPTLSSADGSFSILVPNATYQLQVNAAGYQPYRTPAITVDDGVLVADIPLAPEVAGTPDAVVFIDESGFSSAIRSVVPGATVEFRNLGTIDHGSRSATSVAAGGWDSGLLAPGETFRTTLTLTGTLNYADLVTGGSYGLLTTDGRYMIALPLVLR